jgi:hypothetical protein
MKTIEVTIKKNSENQISLLFGNMSLGKSLLTMLFLLMLFPLSSSAQVCNLALTVKNNIESVNNDGRTYFIVLQNNTTEEIDVNLLVANYNTGTNPDGSAGSNNVVLNSEILDNNGLAMTNNVHLTSNETLNFQVKMTVPTVTVQERWNNSLLTASSAKCTNYSTSVNIFTFVPIPE